MKTDERLSFDDKLVHIQQKHDVTATLKRAEMMRHAHEAGHMGALPKGSIPLGTVPAVMLREWANEAGVRMDDPKAMHELLTKKLMDSQFAGFRSSSEQFGGAKLWL